MKELPQYLWPLIGVLLGWLLSAVSSGWKTRAERKKVVGRLLTALLDVRSDVRTLRMVSGKMKDLLLDPKEYESFRQHLYSKYFLDSISGPSGVSSLVSELSSYKPVDAYQLNAAVKALLRSKAATLDASSSNEEIYKRMLSMHELGLRMVENKLTRVVLSLAISHGLATGIQLWFRFRKEGKVGPPNEEFLGRFGKDILDRFADHA